MPRPFMVPQATTQATNAATSTGTSTCLAPAPWTLRGEAIVLPMLSFQNGRLLVGAQAWVRYDASPVGPYDEYAVAILTSIGGKWGPHVIEMPVSLLDSMICGRANWGYPKSVRALKYSRRGLSVRFRDGKHQRAFRLSRLWLPIAAVAWTVQVLVGRAVRVPMSLRGRARLCWSRHRLGLCVQDFEFHVQAPQ